MLLYFNLHIVSPLHSRLEIVCTASSTGMQKNSPEILSHSQVHPCNSIRRYSTIKSKEKNLATTHPYLIPNPNQHCLLLPSFFVFFFFFKISFLALILLVANKKRERNNTTGEMRHQRHCTLLRHPSSQGAHLSLRSV